MSASCNSYCPFLPERQSRQERGPDLPRPQTPVQIVGRGRKIVRPRGLQRGRVRWSGRGSRTRHGLLQLEVGKSGKGFSRRSSDLNLISPISLFLMRKYVIKKYNQELYMQQILRHLEVKCFSATECIRDLDKLNLILWFDFSFCRLFQKSTCFKSRQN